jgi:hypothetical protein
MFASLVFGTGKSRSSEKSLDKSEHQELTKRIAEMNKRLQECGSKGDCLYRSAVHQMKHIGLVVPGVDLNAESVKRSALIWLDQRDIKVIFVCGGVDEIVQDIKVVYLPALLGVFPGVKQPNDKAKDSVFTKQWQAYIRTLYGPQAN